MPPTGTKPTFFLDVDGPLNSTNPGKHMWGQKWAESEVHGHTLRYNPGLMDALRELVGEGDVEVVWCTSWVPYAHLLEELFQLPKLGKAFEDCSPYTAWSEKVKAVEKFDQTTDQRWAWVDDETPRKGPLRDNLTDSGRGLLVQVNPLNGLTPAQLRTTKEHLLASMHG